MSRLLVLVVTLIAAGCASSPRTAHDPRIDGSSEPAFVASVQTLLKTLPAQRAMYLRIALQDVWQTTKAELPPGSTDEDGARAFFGRLDGLGYKQVVDLADATPPTVRDQYYAMIPRATLHRELAGGASNTTSYPPDYTGYGLQGMPQYATSCGSVCSR